MTPISVYLMIQFETNKTLGNGIRSIVLLFKFDFTQVMMWFDHRKRKNILPCDFPLSFLKSINIFQTKSYHYNLNFGVNLTSVKVSRFLGELECSILIN